MNTPTDNRSSNLVVLSYSMLGSTVWGGLGGYLTAIYLGLIPSIDLLIASILFCFLCVFALLDYAPSLWPHKGKDLRLIFYPLFAVPIMGFLGWLRYRLTVL